MIAVLLLTLSSAVGANDPDAWSEAAIVRQGTEPVVRFQARIAHDYLIVKATHTSGWHTYAMDNERRAAAALKGRKSLGIEQGISITVKDGLSLGGTWLQTPPQDYSQPELRWYTYGFDQTAYFACPLTEITSPQPVLQIHGQACSGEVCCQIDVTLDVPLNADDTPPNELAKVLKELIPIQK